MHPWSCQKSIWGCRCLPAACIKVFCARHLQCRMPEDGKQHEGYMPTQTLANTLCRKKNQKLIAESIFVYSVYYIQVSHELISSSPFIWSHENKSVCISLRLFKTYTYLHEKYGCSQTSQDS